MTELGVRPSGSVVRPDHRRHELARGGKGSLRHGCAPIRETAFEAAVRRLPTPATAAKLQLRSFDGAGI